MSLHIFYCLALSQMTNFRLFQTVRAFANDNFILMKMVESSSKCVENTVEKGEIALYKQFFLFPQCFQKTCTADM